MENTRTEKNSSETVIHPLSGEHSSIDFPMETIQGTNNNSIDASKLDSTKNNTSQKVQKNDKLEDSGKRNRLIPAPIQKYAGMILTLIASLVFSFAVLIVKILNSPEYGIMSYSASFWRYLGIFVPAIPLLIYSEHKYKTDRSESVFDAVWPLVGSKTNSEKRMTMIGLLLRGILAASSVILRYYALEYLSIGDTSVITYATPMLVIVMAHFCLGEKAGFVPFLAAIFALCGVIAITRPPFLTGEETFDVENLVGVSLACASLFCAALLVIVTRKIRKVHFSLTTFTCGFIGIIQAFALTQIFDVFRYPLQLYDTLLVLALMALSFIGQMAIILALTFEQAGPVSLIRSCDVIFGFLFQFIFLGVTPDILSAIGGIIILTCVTVTGMRKWVSTLPEEDKNRRRFKILLI